MEKIFINMDEKNSKTKSWSIYVYMESICRYMRLLLKAYVWSAIYNECEVHRFKVFPNCQFRIFPPMSHCYCIHFIDEKINNKNWRTERVSNFHKEIQVVKTQNQGYKLWNSSSILYVLTHYCHWREWGIISDPTHIALWKIV